MNEINIKFFFIFQLLFKIIKLEQSCFEYSCEECTNSNYGSCTKCKKDFKLIDVLVHVMIQIVHYVNHHILLLIVIFVKIIYLILEIIVFV